MKRVILLFLILSSVVSINAQFALGDYRVSKIVGIVSYNGTTSKIDKPVRFYITKDIAGKVTLRISDEGNKLYENTWANGLDVGEIKGKGKQSSTAEVYIKSGDTALCHLIYSEELDQYIAITTIKEVADVLGVKPGDTLESTMPARKVLSGDFDISKNISAYSLEADKMEIAATGVTYHIKQNDFNSAGKVITCWFQKDGNRFEQKTFKGEDVEVVKLKDPKNKNYTYMVNNNDFTHVILVPSKEANKYIVQHYSEER